MLSLPVLNSRYFVVPSGPPVNVTVQAISSSSLLITWQPPEQLHQNGITAGYRIQIGHVDGLSPREYTLNADVNSYRVTGDKFAND